MSAGPQWRPNHFTRIAKVLVYRSEGEWYYSAWCSDGDFDSSEPLGIDDECSTEAAIAEAAGQFPEAEVSKTADVTGDGSRVVQ